MFNDQPVPPRRRRRSALVSAAAVPRAYETLIEVYGRAERIKSICEALRNAQVMGPRSAGSLEWSVAEISGSDDVVATARFSTDSLDHLDLIEAACDDPAARVFVKISRKFSDELVPVHLQSIIGGEPIARVASRTKTRGEFDKLVVFLRGTVIPRPGGGE